MKQSTAPFECVRFYDPAIDYPEDGGGTVAAEYAVHRDMKTLSFVDEAVSKPVIFKCRVLSQSQRREVTGSPDDAEARRRAFQYGVLSARNYPRDGSFVTWEPKRRSDAAKMDDACLDDFGENDIQEIGSVIVGKSFLGLGVPLRLQPLASSQDAWMAVRLQYAERKKASETRAE